MYLTCLIQDSCNSLRYPLCPPCLCPFLLCPLLANGTDDLGNLLGEFSLPTE